jgi:hypothetical protein
LIFISPTTWWWHYLKVQGSGLCWQWHLWVGEDKLCFSLGQLSSSSWWRLHVSCSSLIFAN